MTPIITSIDIAAPIEDVWQHLTDLGSHASWNPFITSADGVVTEGGGLHLTLALPGRKPQRFSPTVTAVEPPNTFEWLGSIGIRGLFDGRHRFDLSETDSGTHLVQSERFTGILAPIVLPMIRAKTIEGFEAMNRALRATAEARSPHNEGR
jgi:hypothetical protein